MVVLPLQVALAWVRPLEALRRRVASVWLQELQPELLPELRCYLLALDFRQHREPQGPRPLQARPLHREASGNQRRPAAPLASLQLTQERQHH